MRFLSTLILTLVIGTCLGQDTVHYDGMDVVYVNGQISQKIYYGKIDIKVLYIYKDGVLLRREWWQKGKRISYTIDN
jgi:hypothetical protein